MIAAGKRYGIIAGNGTLPLAVAVRLAALGAEPVIIGIDGEADSKLTAFGCSFIALEKIAFSLPEFKNRGVTHVVFAGGVMRRPKATALRVPVALWPDLPAALMALKRGDDSLLVTLVKMFERHGIKIVGAHEILPDHIAPRGIIVGEKPATSLHAAIKAGVVAATAIGGLDIGQAVVAMGRRVIAVEGLEGTDEMLARISDLRTAGKIESRAKPVLVKLAKPRQELRADMPVIGPSTIEVCQHAGINLICIGADTTMMMDVGLIQTVAKSAGITVYGIDPAEWGDTSP